jgi:DNA-binding MarR family transcriptional regulator
LLRVSVDAADRRNRLLHLTEAGREVLVDAVPIWLAMHGAVEAELGARGGERLRHSLAALV